MMYRVPLQRTLLALLTGLVCSQSFAGVVITGTRLVYPAEAKEITVKLNNNGDLPALIQSWVDSGDVKSTPTSSKAPFLLSPPVARMDANKGQSLRLIFTGAQLPTNVESVFWFNMLEIPPKPEGDNDANILQMAFRSRIKIFYRPAGLPGTPDEAMKQVQWKIVPAAQGKGYALQAYNPSPYFVSEVELALVSGKQRSASENGMVAPGETKQFALPSVTSMPSSDAVVEFNAINDYGALIPVKQALAH